MMEGFCLNVIYVQFEITSFDIKHNNLCHTYVIDRMQEHIYCK